MEVTGNSEHRLRFRRPDRAVIADYFPLPATDHRAVPDQNRQLGLDIDHLTGVPTWADERLDLDLCIESLVGAGRGAAARELHQ